MHHRLSAMTGRSSDKRDKTEACQVNASNRLEGNAVDYRRPLA
jgi:hypothetical protein